MSTLCKQALQLGELLGQVADMLTAEGLDAKRMQEVQAYKDASAQYITHRQTCPVCKADLDATSAWARQIIMGG